MSRRVVITGAGAVSGFGYGAGALWEGLCAGSSAIAPIEAFDAAGMRCGLGVEARGFSAKDHVPKSYRKAVKVMARDIELAVGAAKDAVERAGIVTKGAGDGAEPTYRPDQVGCQIGAGLIAADVSELAMALSTSTDDSGRFSYQAWGESGINNLTPLWLLKYLPNMLACHVTIIHEACGPSNTITCGEASGLLSIGESLRVIQRSDAELCFSGGAESKVNPMGVLRLEYAGRLAGAEDCEGVAPESIVRPYDPGSPGGVVGEGAGILLLEARDSAEARGADALAEIVGFGAGQSPRSTEPEQRAEGLTIAVENALSEAGLEPGEIDAIMPAATGVPRLDETEAHALQSVFGPGASGTPLITLPGAIGDTMAGAGALQACVGAMCVKEQRLPARLHGGSPAHGMDAGASESREAKLERVLVCTGSLGGQNAALVLARA